MSQQKQAEGVEVGGHTPVRAGGSIRAVAEESGDSTGAGQLLIVFAGTTATEAAAPFAV